MGRTDLTRRFGGGSRGKLILTGVFGLLTLWNLAFAFRNIVRARSPYTYGDWVINYADGFVRRGLGGETVLALSNLTGVSAVHVAMAIISALTVFVFCGLLVILLRNLRLIDVAIVLAPIALMFGVLDPSEAGRKDLIPLAVVVASCLLMSRRRPLPPLAELAFTTVLGSIGMLVHETTLFYLAPLFVLHLVRIEESERRVAGRIWLMLAGGLLCALFVLIAASAKVDLSTIRLMCARLADAAPQACESFDGAIGWLRAPASYGIGTVKAQLAAGTLPSVYGLPLILALVYMLAYASRFTLAAGVGASLLGGRLRFAFQPVVLVLVFFAATVPLYILAIDWGRWLMVWFVCGFVFLKTALGLGVLERRDGPVVGRLTEAHLALALLIGALFWSTPHCCAPVRTVFDKTLGLVL